MPENLIVLTPRVPPSEVSVGDRASLLAHDRKSKEPMSESELKVDVYEGPTECDAADMVKKGDHLSMHYTGTIAESSETGEKGKQFDSSRTRGSTFDFKIGAGRVIKGWDEGLVGLCKGAKANILIPPALGYGDAGAGGDIPAHTRHANGNWGLCRFKCQVHDPAASTRTSRRAL